MTAFDTLILSVPRRLSRLITSAAARPEIAR
jgi:hypothetical protein